MLNLSKNKTTEISKDNFLSHKIWVVSMHDKEAAIAPYFKKILGAQVFGAKDINTDKFGTFSGEIVREASPLETAKLKLAAFFKKHPKRKIAIASEGSFFPHPEFMLATLNEELLVYQDREQDIELVVRYYSTKTNLASIELGTTRELIDFAKNIGFPKHALILKLTKNLKTTFKGITTFKSLKIAFEKLKKLSIEEKIIAETDMRACFNPTRMKNIGKAAQILAKQLKTKCPKCRSIGFGIKLHKPGLPCECCGTPTRLTLSHIYDCKKCGFEEEKQFPDIKKAAFAGYCLNCNP